MVVKIENDKRQKAIVASWERCKYQHSLAADSSYSILRLQSSEVAPRLEALVEQTGGRRGIFRQVSEIALSARHCLIISDTDGFIVRCETNDRGRSQFENHGIALGSCWNERVAGTNGVAMALSQPLGTSFTVRGNEHYFSKLKNFVCTAVPLLDAQNNIVGAANLATIDQGNAAEYLFQRQLLEQAARNIQHILFQQHYSDSLILSLSDPSTVGLLPNNELIAVDSSGVVSGSTNMATNLPNALNLDTLNGQDIESVVGFALKDLIRNQGKELNIHFDSGLELNISIRDSEPANYSESRLQKKHKKQRSNYSRQPLTPSLKALAYGSQGMEAVIGQALVCFNNSIPLLIEGESGTGKTEIVKKLHAATGGQPSSLVIVDCAALPDNESEDFQIAQLMEHARVTQTLQRIDNSVATLVLENINEMPRHGQIKLRRVLESIESDTSNQDSQEVLPLRIVATTRKDLYKSMNDGLFREDLYYLVCTAHIALPPLREREGREILARLIAKQLSGNIVEITDECIAAIRSYDWPGNVRELRNTLRQSLIAGNGERISLLDLSLYSHVNVGLSNTENQITNQSNLLERMDEQNLLKDALISANWNVTLAARTLKIGRATLNRKMKQFGITRPQRNR